MFSNHRCLLAVAWGSANLEFFVITGGSDGHCCSRPWSMPFFLPGYHSLHILMSKSILPSPALASLLPGNPLFPLARNVPVFPPFFPGSPRLHSSSLLCRLHTISVPMEEPGPSPPCSCTLFFPWDMTSTKVVTMKDPFQPPQHRASHRGIHDCSLSPE